MMGRREWRCRNQLCPVPHGAVSGKLANNGNGLVLEPGAAIAAVYLDAGRVEVACLACWAVRDFRGRFLSAR
jgi:hypothetical protein